MDCEPQCKLPETTTSRVWPRAESPWSGANCRLDAITMQRRSFFLHEMIVHVRLSHPTARVGLLVVAGVVFPGLIAGAYGVSYVGVPSAILILVVSRWLPWTVVSVGGIASVFNEQHKRRNINAMVQHGIEHYCKHCRYDLSALGDEDNCPECGRPYTKADNAAYWAPIRNYGRLTRRAGQYFRHVLRTRPRQNP